MKGPFVLSMEKHVDFAHALRWPFLLGWLIVLGIWCGVLFIPLQYDDYQWDSFSLLLWFPDTPSILRQTWLGYLTLMLFAPIATLSPHRYWHHELADRKALPRRMLIAGAIAAGVLNMSVIEVGVILREVMVHGLAIKSEYLLPLSPLHRLSGVMLMSLIWGMIFQTWFSRRERVLYSDYKLLSLLLGMGLIIGPFGTKIVGRYVFYYTSQQIDSVPGFTAALMMQISVVLWAMGTSAILLFGIRPFFRYANCRCMKCGYDLQGSMEHGDGTCPECGFEIEQEQANVSRDD